MSQSVTSANKTIAETTFGERRTTWAVTSTSSLR